MYRYLTSHQCDPVILSLDHVSLSLNFRQYVEVGELRGNFQARKWIPKSRGLRSTSIQLDPSRVGDRP